LVVAVVRHARVSGNPALHGSAARWLRARVGVSRSESAAWLLASSLPGKKKADVVILGPPGQFSASLLSSHYFADDA
jgi:hypothetical protein